MLTRPLARGCPAALALAVLLAVAAPARADDIAPPYKLTAGTTGELVVSPAAGASTIATTIEGEKPFPGDVAFTPAAQTAPPGCTSSPTETICDASLMSKRLLIDAEVLEVDVSGVATELMTLNGGADTDALTVEGPTLGALVGSLQTISGPGADAVTVRGNVAHIQDFSGMDEGADRYVIESPTITGELQPAGGDDSVRSDAPGLVFEGGDGDDTIIAPASLNGSAGNDLLKPTTAFAPVDGGPGADRVSYEKISDPLSLGLTGGGDVSVNGAPTGSHIEALEGGAGIDTLVGDGAANVLAGGAGDDTLRGLGGVDDLDGGPGSDTVSYADESGRVVVVLGAGTGGPAGAVDALRSFEAVVTGAGNDLVVGTATRERVGLGAGDDEVDAGGGDDVADGGGGNDLLRGGSGDDDLAGGDGADTVTYGERGTGERVVVTLDPPGTGGSAGEHDALTGIEDVVGGAAGDELTGDGGANTLSGGPGTDTLVGRAGDDRLLGGDARDILDGGPGSDGMFGEDGDDTLMAFDNEADGVDCGPSPDDDAQVDPFDAVNGCEYARRLDIPVPIDDDRDGIVAGFDCDDHDPAKRPGATDVPADDIDQNCDGFDESLPFVSATPSLATRQAGSGRRVRHLSVTGLQAGSRVRMTCTPPKGRRRACPFRRYTRSAKGSSRISLTARFRRRVMPAGTRIELRVTTPGAIGKVWRYTFAGRGDPREAHLCLTKGAAAKPQRCPPEEA